MDSFLQLNALLLLRWESSVFESESFRFSLSPPEPGPRISYMGVWLHTGETRFTLASCECLLSTLAAFATTAARQGMIPFKDTD